VITKGAFCQARQRAPVAYLAPWPMSRDNRQQANDLQRQDVRALVGEVAHEGLAGQKPTPTDICTPNKLRLPSVVEALPASK
jgi:hypothetical protein